MLPAFVITLREGLEAFLIVAISLAYLRKSGRQQLIPAVHWGIAVSVLVSIGAAVLFQRASNQALWEGVLALVAAVLVGSLIVHMWRHARKIKSEIEGAWQASAAKVGLEGDARRVPLHAADDHARGHGDRAPHGHAPVRRWACRASRWARSAARVRAAFVAWLWSRYGHRVNLGAVLPGDGRVPGGVRRPADDLRIPRADGSQPLPGQRAAALGDGALRSRRHLRSVPELRACWCCRSRWLVVSSFLGPKRARSSARTSSSPVAR